jgi:tRNA dimethylallyltransferase
MVKTANGVPKMVVVVGETASGKSALAVELARQFDGELVCADSWTVYEGFNVGTAKPSAAERAAVRHHLLDVADPRQGFSAVEFQKLAKAAIEDITGRGKLPIMVGGTGLYIDSVLYEYEFLPAPAEVLRDELNVLTLEQLQTRAGEMRLDTTGIDMRNKRRIIRLIENEGVRPGRGEMRDNTLVLGLARDREHLRERVEARVDAMLAAGLEDEVKALADKYGWEAEPMKGIGYREWRPYFEPRPELHQDVALTRERIVAATMGLAKRQRTWFKRNPRIHWLEGMNTTTEAVDLVTTLLGD